MLSSCFLRGLRYILWQWHDMHWVPVSYHCGVAEPHIPCLGFWRSGIGLAAPWSPGRRKLQLKCGQWLSCAVLQPGSLEWLLVAFSFGGATVTGFSHFLIKWASLCRNVLGNLLWQLASSELVTRRQEGVRRASPPLRKGTRQGRKYQQAASSPVPFMFMPFPLADFSLPWSPKVLPITASVEARILIPKRTPRVNGSGHSTVLRVSTAFWLVWHWQFSWCFILVLVSTEDHVRPELAL